MKLGVYVVVSVLAWAVATGVLLALGTPFWPAVVGGGLAATGLVYELSTKLRKPPQAPR